MRSFWFFQCAHKRTTFPMTRVVKDGVLGLGKETYVCCLSCGRELGYDWELKRPGKELPLPEPRMEVARR